MLERRRATGSVLVTVALLSTAACTAGVADRDPAAAAAASSEAGTAPGVYGSTRVPIHPDPESVATDGPVAADQSGPEVPVLITYAGWEATSGAVEVGAYVAGLVEEGGTCTLALRHAGTQVETSVPGSADAVSTTCGGLAIAGDQLSPGTWTAVVTYESATSSGTSDEVRVDMP